MPDRPRHELSYASPGDNAEQSRRRIRVGTMFMLRLLIGAIITGVLYLLLLAAAILLTRLG